MNETIDKSESVSNAGFVYKNLCDTKMHLLIEKRDGNLKRNFRNADDKIESQYVFEIFYDWGNELKNGRYVYQVSPIELAHKSPDVLNIINDKSRQIIEFGDGMVIGFCVEDCMYEKVDGHHLNLNEGILFINKVQ